jgi:DNA adenine methylase
MDTPEAPRRPALRYHGAKWRLAPWIIRHLPEHRIYIEPFAGSAGVLLRKPRAFSEVINDLDGDLVNLFRVLRDPASAARLIRQLELTPFAREEFAGAGVPAAEMAERARRLLVRSHMGFGSDAACGHPCTGFRAKCARSRTTAAHDWAGLPKTLASVVARLRGVVIEHRDALEVIAQQDRHDALFYVDPPYLAATRRRSHRRGGSSYRHEMATEEAHRRLAAALRGVTGAVALSGYPSPLYDELYAGWRHVEKRAMAEGARVRTEVLWMNYPPPHAGPPPPPQPNRSEAAG